MATLESLRALLRPLSRRVALLVGRGVVRASDDAGRLQTIQAGLLPGETRGPLERFGQFGWTSRPPVGSEAIALFFNGSRDHGVVVAVEDRATRPTDLEEGESCAYNAVGVRIHLRLDGSIEITAAGGVRIAAPSLTLSGDLRVDGSIDAGGSATVAGAVTVQGYIASGTDVSDSRGSIAEVRETFNVHTHGGVESGSSITAPPVPPMV